MTELPTTTAVLGPRERRDHLLARLGYRRMDHRVEPGLYRLGDPTPDSPVFVSANYSLSFDALRSALRGVDAFILVLDTKGINVWCAAGKGTFGTDELVERIEATGLRERVAHRRLVLPQLAAPGVAAHEVKRRSGFTVDYGPVRASDLPAYLRTGPTAEMRRVSFPLRDRAVLVPVEMRNVALYTILAVVGLYLLGGAVPALIALAAVLAGTALFPLLLPFLPTADFTSKGLLLGDMVAIPFALYYLLTSPGWAGAGYAVGTVLLIAPVVGYLALNFTGCSTYASRTGVRREIFRYMPVLVALAVAGLTLLTVTAAGTTLEWF